MISLSHLISISEYLMMFVMLEYKANVLGMVGSLASFGMGRQQSY